jgi:hypothetical protein
MGTNESTQINTGGGAYVGGDVQAARDFIGRDKFEIAIHLKDVDDAARVTRKIVADLSKGDPESESIRTTLLSLMEELRRTHSTLVKLVSPLRRLKDNPGTFGDEFEAVYNDFREFYDHYDFADEHTHCHRIRRIKVRLEKHNAPITQTPEWGQLQQDLLALYDADIDLIDAYYLPFAQRFNDVMIKIHGYVEHGEIEQAITLKRVFLDALTPEHDDIKAMLRYMTDAIAEIEDSLD